MRNLILVITTFFSWTSLQADVEICYPNGDCDDISRVKIDGEWQNACCDNFALGPGYTCTDDCGGEVASIIKAEPAYLDELSRENAVAIFKAQRRLFKFWLMESGAAVTGSIDSAKKEAIVRMMSQVNIDQMELNLSNERSLMVKRTPLLVIGAGGAFATTKKSDDQIDSLKQEWDSYHTKITARKMLFADDAVVVTPNPIESGESIQINVKEKVHLKRLELIHQDQLCYQRSFNGAPNEHYNYTISMEQLTCTKQGVYLVSIADQYGNNRTIKVLRI